jgi:serine/threonine-protein kinase
MPQVMSGAGEFSGTITAGSYRRVRALGGGAGRVYEARHDRLPGRFALKLFDEVDARAYQRAAQQAAALRHPGIARVVDYGLVDGGAFAVMEWVDGRSLAAVLAAGPLAPDAVARIIDSVALGLQAAHRQGVAHGHLAPERILVQELGVAADDETPGAEHTKILGFGLGPREALRPGISITEVTPYTAPEQLAGDATPVADQFALAAIAYHLLAGAPPAGDALLERPPRSLREYDPTINVIVDDVVQRALAFDPAARWPDVYTFSKRLREAIDGDGALEEKTRLAPLPLTVKSAPRTPAPDRSPPLSIVLPPVIASVDVDLRTPAPQRHELPLRGLAPSKLPVQGEIAMNPPPTRHQPDLRASQLPGQLSPPRFAPSQPHRSFQPTPTFSFTDEPLPGPMYRPRRRRGGGFGLFLAVIAAGVGGYLAVQPRVLQEAEPYLARAKELVRSLRTLAPGASPELTAPAPATNAASTPPTTPSPSPTANAAAAPVPAAPPAAATAPAPAMHPEVVPIAPQTTAARAAAPKATHHASRARRTHEPAHRTARASKTALSDEAATEEALLAAP